MSTEIEKFKKTKYTCYFTYLAMASVFALPPILFVTFREMYGISYTLLGTLVLVNFCSQLTIDLIFTFFTRYFNVHKVVRIMPLLTSTGLFIYAVTPLLVPRFIYAGLLAGTIIFSIAAGLCEVLLSPLVAALPSDNPERDMSMLHSLYAWGVVTVVVISTLFLKIFGRDRWMYLTMFWALLPLVSVVLYSIVPLPQMELSSDTASGRTGQKNRGLSLCVLCIFLGSCAENAMTNWISGYMEAALRIPKVTGDILGLALFAILLGVARTAYAKYGKHIYPILLWGMVGATVCYLIVGISTNPFLSVAACVFTGLCTSMLWPGTLIFMEEKFPAPGVAAYALMAAGGDFGGSIAPQLLGIVVDRVSESAMGARLAATFSLSAEQIGMKAGMLTAALFPLLGVFLLLYMKKYFGNRK